MSDADFSHLPRTVEIPDKPLTWLLEQAVAKYPNNVAISFFGIELTYGQFDREVQKAMNVLRGLGVQPGEAVAMMSPNSPQAFFIYQAVMRIGAIITQINPLYVEREVEHQLKDSGAKVAFVLNLLTPRVEPCFENTGLEKIVVTRLDDYMPWLMGHLFNLKMKIDKRWVNVNYDEKHLMWSELFENASSEAKSADVNPNDTALYQYTGGTTGVAKGVELTHKNILSNTLQGRAWFTNAVEGKETFMLALPIFHAFGMTVGMNLAIALSSKMVLTPKFDAGDVMKLIEKEKVTLYPGVPAMYSAINNHKSATKRDISSIKYCISGAATLPIETKRRFEELTGGKLVEGYGLTEASPTTHCNPVEGINKTGSIGLPLPNTESKIVTDENATEAEQGKIGELIIRGPQIMKGYRNHPEETAQVLRNGWLFTGDMGYVDEDGFIFLMDRKKEMIITGGYNVYPKEVEEELAKIDGIIEAAAIGLPNDYLGESVTVAVVKEEGSTLTEEEVIEFCKKSLAGYKVPKKVVFFDELPKTIIGKVLKRLIKDKLLEG